MTRTYEKMRGYRGYFPLRYTCAGARACAHPREIFSGLKITSANLVTSQSTVARNREGLEGSNALGHPRRVLATPMEGA